MALNQFDPNTMGLNNFVWFQGVVEDREDPKKLGRVKVRVFGFHTQDKKLIPTEHLPWAPVVHSVFSTAMSGLGESPSFLVEGTWVFGFFRDGIHAQQPVILGSLPGIPEEAANTNIGFYDPRTSKLANHPRKVEIRNYPNDGSGAQLQDEPQAKNFPRTVHPFSNTLNEPDTNRLARNQDISTTVVQVKKDQRDLAIKTGLGQGSTWDEPETSYNSVYPFNHVKESESGHIEETDDTPGAERTHKYHRTGTFEEVHPDGSRVTKIVRNDYKIVLIDDHVHVQGVCNLTVDGHINIYAKSNVHLEVEKNVLAWVKQDVDIKVDGDVQLDVGGDVDVVVGGDVAADVKGHMTAKIGGNLVGEVMQNTELHTHEDMALKTDGSVYHTVGGDYTLNIAGNYRNTAGGTHLSQSGGPMTLIGVPIHLNPVV